MACSEAVFLMSLITLDLPPLKHGAWVIKPLTENDIPDALAIENRTHLTPWNETHFRDAVRGRQHAYGIFSGPVLLGYAVLSTVAQEAELLLFVVDESFHGKGIGQAFLNALLGYYQTQVTAFFLEVRAGNVPAISLYEKLGFNQVGERPRYYSTPWGREDALIYALDWQFL